MLSLQRVDAGSPPPSASLADLLRAASFELLPREAESIARFGDFVPSGARIFIPDLGSAHHAANVALAARLAREGMRPVAHLAARRFASRDACREYVDALMCAGVSDVLLIGGDLARPAGPFDCARSLLDAGMLAERRLRIAFGGHPQGAPGIAPAALAAATRAKIALASDAQWVSQLAFDVPAILAWVAHLRSCGARGPIRASVPGRMEWSALMRLARVCGVPLVAQSVARTVAKSARHYARLLQPGIADTMAVRIADAIRREPHDAPTGLHFLTFGAFESTARWASAILARAAVRKEETDGWRTRIGAP